MFLDVHRPLQGVVQLRHAYPQVQGPMAAGRRMEQKANDFFSYTFNFRAGIRSQVGPAVVGAGVPPPPLRAYMEWLNHLP
jgi:hypothetical protein